MGLCAICRQARTYKLNVDHDHKLDGRESVRGLLCRRCNKVLAICHDTPEILAAAAAYLLNPPAQEVLIGNTQHRHERWWSVFDRRTGQQVTVAVFRTEASAQRTLNDWRRREVKGGRPDVTTEFLYVAQKNDGSGA